MPITDAKNLKSNQYKTSENLKKRMALYEHGSVPGQQSFIRHFLSNTNLSPNENTIDFGCGNARIWQQAQGEGKLPNALTLVDLSQGMLKEARAALGETPRFICHDLNQPLPPDGSHDRVCAFHMLYHLVEPLTCLDNFLQHLSPGGSAYVSLNAAGTQEEPSVGKVLGTLVSEFLGTPVPKIAQAVPTPAWQTVQDHWRPAFRRDDCHLFTNLIRVTNSQVVFDYIMSMSALHGDQLKDHNSQQAFQSFLDQRVSEAVTNEGALHMFGHTALLEFLERQ